MEKQLARFLLVISALHLLTACGEMKVIGNAAMRELKADGISVEWTASRASSPPAKN